MRDHLVRPQTYARVGGVLYLYIIVAALFAEAFVRGKLIVSGDASATAHNIMASESLWRLGFGSELLVLVCDVALALILYVLLKPVDRNIALLAAFFRLMWAAIYAVADLGHFAPLLLLGGADYLKIFDAHQLQAFALLSLKLHAYGYNLGLVFFGFHCILIGFLIFRSGYFPKLLGALLTIAGFCYVFNSMALFLAPAFEGALFPFILLPGALAEYSFCLWLIIKGVNVSKWEQRLAIGREGAIARG